MSLVLPAAVLRKECVEFGVRVRDGVNAHHLRNRLELSGVTVTGENECVVSWVDRMGPRDCELKCIWRVSDACPAWEGKLIEMIVAGGIEDHREVSDE